jgi:hypothetical protein
LRTSSSLTDSPQSPDDDHVIACDVPTVQLSPPLGDVIVTLHGMGVLIVYTSEATALVV